MKYKDFDSLSGKARIAYASLCLEKYVLAKYPDVDFSEVIDKAANIADNLCGVDVNAYTFCDLIPEYLYEHGEYRKEAFYYLTEAKYCEFEKIIPSNDAKLNTIMMAIADLALDFPAEDVRENSTELTKILFKAIHVLEEENIDLPDLTPLLPYNNYAASGWGYAVPYSKFSYILDDDKYNKKDPYSLRDFDEISLYGHITFALLCLENYVLEIYPDVDYAPVIKLASEMVEKEYRLDETAHAYLDVISNCFKGVDMPEKSGLTQSASKPNELFNSIICADDEDLQTIMVDIYKIASAYDFKSLPPKPRELTRYNLEIIEVLKSKGIQIPQLELLKGYQTQHTPNGFGYPIPYEQHSQILG